MPETYTLAVSEQGGNVYTLQNLPPGAFEFAGGVLTIRPEAVKSVTITRDGDAPPPPPPPPSGNVARIGTTEYATLAAAAAKVAGGEIVLVLPGEHVGQKATAAFERNCSVVGGEVRPVLDGTGATRLAWGKALVLFSQPSDGSGYVENLILRGARNADRNGAGIRIDAGCLNLAVHNVLCENNENGMLLTGDPLKSVAVLIGIELKANGLTDRTHNIYADKLKRLEIQDALIHGAVGGHEIKSRAAENEFSGLNVSCGRQARAIDLPNGGKLLVRDSKLFKAADAQQGELIGIGFEGFTHAVQSYEFINCELTVLRQPGLFQNNKSTVPVRYQGCTFNGQPTPPASMMAGPYEIVE